MEIEAGSDLVTVTGRGLERLVEALDRSALEVLREIEGEIPPVENGVIWVNSMLITGPAA